MSSKQFVASLDRWKNKLNGRLDKAVQNIGFSLAEEVIVGGKYSPGSPVDTGFFRANWMVALEELPDAALLDRPAGSTKGQYPASLDAVTLVLARVKAGARVFIFNNARYGVALERGHSGQAPRGMVRIAVAAGQHIVDDTVKQMVGE